MANVFSVKSPFSIEYENLRVIVNVKLLTKSEKEHVSNFDIITKCKLFTNFVKF